MSATKKPRSSQPRSSQPRSSQPPSSQDQPQVPKKQQSKSRLSQGRKETTSFLANLKPECNPDIMALAMPHIQSYDHFLTQGLKDIASSLTPIEFTHIPQDFPLPCKIRLWVESFQVSTPTALGPAGVRNVFPAEVYLSISSFFFPPPLYQLKIH